LIVSNALHPLHPSKVYDSSPLKSQLERAAKILAVGIESNLSEALDELARLVPPRNRIDMNQFNIRKLIQNELDMGENDNSFPLKPQRIVADVRKALGESDFVLVDTGALKMWMARLYPTYKSNTHA
jgi:acetolactate synthase-1/2/3 large subunit